MPALIPTKKVFSLKSIQPASYNPRTISKEALSGLSESIKKFGYLESIVVNTHNGKPVCISGHQRLKALEMQGVKSVECITVDFVELTEKAAKYAVMRWHYSKTMPSGKKVNIGVWENGKYIGCVIFAQGASPHLGHAYKLDQVNICELCRVALNEHKTPVSKIVSVAIKLLKRQSPGIKLVVSFADSNEGHLGVVYQAGNWLYSGVTEYKYLYFDKKGQRIADRRVTTSGVTMGFMKLEKCYKPDDLRKELQKPKFRYLYPLTKEMREQIEPLRKPYPKALIA